MPGQQTSPVAPQIAERPSSVLLSGTAARHELIYADLCARIRAGQYPLETQLPSERELTALYGVSRVTLRQALEKAEQDGIVTKIPGRGNFVTRRGVAQNLSVMQTFRSVIEALDMRPSYSVLACTWVSPPEEIASRLHILDGRQALQVDAVGMANGRPMATYRSYLDSALGERVQPHLSDAGRSTYEVAGEILGVDELRVDQSFESVLLDEPAARLLQVATGSAAFRATSLFTTPEREPIEVRTALYPGGRYSFTVDRIVRLTSNP